MYSNRIWPTFLTVILVCSNAACSRSFKDTPPELVPPDGWGEFNEESSDIALQTRVESQVQFKNKALPKDAVEVLWRIPAEPVRLYYLYYGSQPNLLSSSIPLPVNSLEKVDHPVYGPSYRYLIRGVNPKKKVYIRLIAENATGLSDPGEGSSN